MKSKIFIDSNIFLYAIDQANKSKQKKSRAVLLNLAREKHGVISTQVIEECYNGAVMKLKVSPPKARRWIEQFDNFEIVQLDFDLIKSGIDCSILNQLSLWDGLIISAAEASGCRILYTEDLNNGQQIRGVKITNPFLMA